LRKGKKDVTIAAGYSFENDKLEDLDPPPN
jgi:hypothetical protein